MYLLYILVSVCLMLEVFSLPLPKEWRGIIPLKSTRADIESLLGPPEKSDKTLHILENENVRVWYSLGSCARDPKGWNVPADTVTEFTVYYKTKIPISTLNLDESRYEKIKDPHVAYLIYYKNQHEGTLIEVDTNAGLVNNVTFLPESKDDYLRCPGSTANTSRADGDGLIDSEKFDEYSAIPYSQEKKRLDHFARELTERQRNESDTKGYIISHAGQHARIGKALVRAERAKIYLLGKHRLKENDIEVIDGGYRRKGTVELWIRPNGGRAPNVSPSLVPSGVQINRKTRRKNSISATLQERLIG